MSFIPIAIGKHVYTIVMHVYSISRSNFMHMVISGSPMLNSHIHFNWLLKNLIIVEIVEHNKCGYDVYKL